MGCVGRRERLKVADVLSEYTRERLGFVIRMGSAHRRQLFSSSLEASPTASSVTLDIVS